MQLSKEDATYIIAYTGASETWDRDVLSPMRRATEEIASQEKMIDTLLQKNTEEQEALKQELATLHHEPMTLNESAPKRVRYDTKSVAQTLSAIRQEQTPRATTTTTTTQPISDDEEDPTDFIPLIKDLKYGYPVEIPRDTNCVLCRERVRNGMTLAFKNYPYVHVTCALNTEDVRKRRTKGTWTNPPLFTLQEPIPMDVLPEVLLSKAWYDFGDRKILERLRKAKNVDFKPLQKKYLGTNNWKDDTILRIPLGENYVDIHNNKTVCSFCNGTVYDRGIPLHPTHPECKQCVMHAHCAAYWIALHRYSGNLALRDEPIECFNHILKLH